MKNIRLGCILIVTGLGLASFSSPAMAQKTTDEATPKPVLDAFKTKFPGYKINAIKKEVAEGKPVYEIESTKDGMGIDALLKPDGSFINIEKEIKEADMPAALAKGVKSKYGTAKLTRIEEVTTGEKVTYEITVKKTDGSKVAIFDKAGKFIEEE